MRYFMIFLCLSFAAPAFAASELVISRDGVVFRDDLGQKLSGVVTRAKRESVYIDTGDKEIEVKLDEIKTGGRAKNIFKEGQALTAYGFFGLDNDEFEATRVIYMSGGRQITLRRDGAIEAGRKIILGK